MRGLIAAIALCAALAPALCDRTQATANERPDNNSNAASSGGFDARPLLRALFSDLIGTNPSNASLGVNVTAVRVVGFNGEVARDAALRFSQQGGDIRRLLFSGQIGSGAFEVKLRSGGDHRQEIVADTSDAGAFLRFMNIYRRGENGRAQIVLRLPTSAHPLPEGVIEIRDFALRDEPAVRSLAILQDPKSRSDNKLELSRLWLRFALAESVAINKGIAVSPLFSGTMTGMIDWAKDQSNLAGFILPAWQSNSLVPRHDNLDPSEALISVSYRIEGRLEAPALRVDPFGPPGVVVLRQLFAPENGAP
jgi:hypothetical protein